MSANVAANDDDFHAERHGQGQADENQGVAHGLGLARPEEEQGDPADQRQNDQGHLIIEQGEYDGEQTDRGHDYRDSTRQLPVLEQCLYARIAQPIRSLPKQQRNNEKQKQSVNIEISPQGCLSALP